MSDYSDDIDLLLNALTDGDFMFFIDDFSEVCDLKAGAMAFDHSIRAGHDYNDFEGWVRNERV